ncbi:MAG: hypothetical protein QOD00_2815 [Blastocatellia bacterium]|jgi:hypothetical protein|nr:hypothetical protein [Blastocatellia bacterium]
MYCPQCGTESSSGQQYCRVCGANLKVIAKAVTLSEAIARSDRGPLPKIKEMMKSMHIEHVTEEITRALDQMNKEIARSSLPHLDKADKEIARDSSGQHVSHPKEQHDKPWWLHMKERETPEQRRENRITKGTVSFFTGIALMVFLFYFSAAIVLKLPPEWVARIPFDLEPVLRIIWLVGLIPMLSGLGQIIAGLLVRPTPAKSLEAADADATSQRIIEQEPEPKFVQGSVTEKTTELLDWKIPVSRTNEIKE